MARRPRKTPEDETRPDPAQVEHPHNLTAREQREQRAAHRLRLIAGIREARDRRITAQEVVRAQRKIETVLRNDYASNDWSLAILDEAFDREDKPRRDLHAYEAERNEVFEDLGQAVYIQPDLFERMPQAAWDETLWSDDGYQAGIAGKVGKPPEECPPEFTQTWLKRWGSGQERIAWSLADKGINPERSRTDIGVEPVKLGDEDEDEAAELDPLLN